MRLGIRKSSIIKVVSGFILMGFCSFTSVYADGGGDLTTIFSTKAFSGSMEVIDKFNWVGWLLNGIISVFCLLGLFMILYSRMISLLYLSSRNLFDNVYDIKQANTGVAFGMKSLLNNTFQGGYGTGLDSFIGFFYGLLPNVKKYSDFNPEKMQYNLSEEDTAQSYMLKTFPATVLLVFFFSIGFSGTLAKAYGTVVQGMSTAADAAVNVNLSKYVNRILASGNNYSFSLGADGSAEGKVKEDIAKSIYSRVIGRCEIIDTATRQTVGKDVEQKVSKLSADEVMTLTGITDMKSADWSRINYDVIDNTNSDAGTGLVYDFSEFGVETNSNSHMYIHLYLTAEQPDTSVQYFTPTK